MKIPNVWSGHQLHVSVHYNVMIVYVVLKISDIENFFEPEASRPQTLFRRRSWRAV